MAFFNLWSSERLSFSLSIVAVISAAITSYFSFFHYKSDLAIRITGAYYEPSDSSDAVVFGLKGVFINSGTTPLTMVDHFGFLSTDSTQNQGVTTGLESNRVTHCVIPDRFDRFFSMENLDAIVVPSQSTKVFNLSWEIEEQKLKHEIRAAQSAGSRYGIPTFKGNDSTAVVLREAVKNTVAVDLGMYAEFINPKMQSSSIRIYPVQLLFNEHPIIDTVRLTKDPGMKVVGPSLFRLGPFKSLPVSANN